MNNINKNIILFIHSAIIYKIGKMVACKTKENAVLFVLVLK